MKRWLSILAIVMLLVSQEICSQVSDSARFQRRAALVIGNGNYLIGALANPENDARDIALVLKNLGFEVSEYENLTRKQMEIAIDEFGLGLKKNDIALFFYAGHGIQSKGYNYLIPIDATLKSEALVDFECVRADRILALIEENETRVNIMLLDACRNNPFERSWTRAASGKGLATMDAPIGTLIGYATSPGRTASDGSGSNGLFTSALLESIVIPGISIQQVFFNVTRIVSEKSERQQVPWISSSLTGEFFFSNPETSPQAAYVQVQSDATQKSGEKNTVREEPTSKTYPKINGPGDWKSVVVLNKEERASVAGLTETGELKASSMYGGLGGSGKGRSECIRELQKKAAELGCPVVLIVNEQTGMTTKIEGIAYK